MEAIEHALDRHRLPRLSLARADLGVIQSPSDAAE
jgi:hypothetical protein